jgi:hypothetical protein
MSPPVLSEPGASIGHGCPVRAPLSTTQAATVMAKNSFRLLRSKAAPPGNEPLLPRHLARQRAQTGRDSDRGIDCRPAPCRQWQQRSDCGPWPPNGELMWSHSKPSLAPATDFGSDGGFERYCGRRNSAPSIESAANPKTGATCPRAAVRPFNWPAGCARANPRRQARKSA